MSNLRKEIEQALNRECAENRSNTPDFILADYLIDCLNAFDKAANAREAWYGCGAKPSDESPSSLGTPLPTP